jgi:hypothetical protein
MESAIAVLGGIINSVSPRTSISLAWAAAVAIADSYAPLLRHHLHTIETLAVAYGHALRNGEITASQITDAPFGMQAWRLFDLTRPRRDSCGLTDCLGFVEAGRTRCEDGNIVGNRTSANEPLHYPGVLWTVSADFQARTVPLNNDEWRKAVSL